MKSDNIVEFPQVSEVLDRDQMISMNFDQMIGTMIETFGANFTQEIFRVMYTHKVGNTNPIVEHPPVRTRKVAGK